MNTYSTTSRLLCFRLFALLCAFSCPIQFDALAKETAAAKDTTTPVPNKPNPRGPARFENEIAAFEKLDRQNAVPRDPILFVGSSSIRLWQTADAFPGLPVVNRGFGGSTIADVNHFASRIVYKYKPRLIVFYSGDNDIAAGRPPEKVFDDFQRFLAGVRTHLGATPIIYLPIKPSIARWKLWPKMQEVNARVKELSSNDKHLICVDTATPILGDNGQPRAELLRDDGLHLNPQGYAVWNEILAPHLK